MSYSFLEHTADVKFRADGATIEEMFVSAVEALNDVIRGDIEILGQIEKSFVIEGKDRVSLLYEFLEWFLVELDSEDFLVSKIKEIKVEKVSGAEPNVESFRVSGVVTGDKAENYKFTNDVKAVTFSEMYVKEDEGKFVCQVVLDV